MTTCEPAREQPPQFPEIDGQLGLATKRQLRDVGFTTAAIRHALTRRWAEPFPGVVVPHLGPVDADGRLAAAALWAGPDAVLTGTLALDRYGLPGADRGEAVFLVPATARRRENGPVRTVRTTRPTRIGKELGCVMIATVERALVDARCTRRSPPGTSRR